MPEAVAAWRPPQGPGVELVAGGRSWDAVRIPYSFGVSVVERLGEYCGGVIQDGYAHTLYWLIKPGAADNWEPIPGSSVTILGATSYVAVPPVRRTEGPGLWWKVPLLAVRYLTDADLLWAALEEELDSRLGPRTLLACEPCIRARIFETDHDGCTGTTAMEMHGRQMVPAASPHPCPCDHQPLRSAGA
ncbi:hypothetical protein AB0M87_04325 [Streptomyces sp. NPDC051320]|uniref:hypothetical protein n=1 Tax=Streptomyces sp. NPDC051320 TaxID=3154644 RepID=UPI00342EC0B5